MRMTISMSLLFAVPVYAHVPFVEGLDFQDDQAFALEPPIEKSYAIYSSFNSATDQDRVTFRLSEADFQNEKVVMDAVGRPGRKVTFNTIVPACAPYVAVLPSVVLVGPTQDALPSAGKLPLPLPLAENQGAYFIANTEQGHVIEEKITGTRYFQQKSAELIVTRPGAYEFIVWEPQGRVADYVLVVGHEEIFGPNEIAQSLKRLAYLREGQEIKDENCRQELKP
ncbi:hypothetical protein [Oligoflexus tunisiensis]|uniref:hypothetical protein n=1 Tax=Oligoflexus tunisiensis TaxID=708132 RepID=UPI00114CE022|nr:hypothetical protein [Oligoflexus tunisiensis]